MMAAGIFIESMWQAKRIIQRRIRGKGTRKAPCENTVRNAPAVSLKKRITAVGFILEISFWGASAAVLSCFLYFTAFGKPSFHAAAGFFIGVLLWKKILYYAIMNAKD